MEREKTPQQDIRNNLQLKNVICCFYLNDEKNNKFMFKLYDLSNGFKWIEKHESLVGLGGTSRIRTFFVNESLRRKKKSVVKKKS